MAEQGVTRAVATAEYQSRVKNLKLDTPIAGWADFLNEGGISLRTVLHRLA